MCARPPFCCFVCLTPVQLHGKTLISIMSRCVSSFLSLPPPTPPANLSCRFLRTMRPACVLPALIGSAVRRHRSISPASGVVALKPWPALLSAGDTWRTRARDASGQSRCHLEDELAHSSISPCNFHLHSSVQHYTPCPGVAAEEAQDCRQVRRRGCREGGRSQEGWFC